MHDHASPHENIGKIEVQLLDASSGRPIRTWTFNEQTHIKIGRSPDQDIELSDPYVSRNHASLLYEAGRWHLHSMGRNGVLVDNQLITKRVVMGDTNFRLGVEGPTLRFLKEVAPTTNMKTITFSALPIELFQVDESKVHNEVSEITEGDYFQSLQQRAKDLRRKRNSE